MPCGRDFDRIAAPLMGVNPALRLHHAAHATSKFGTVVTTEGRGRCRCRGEFARVDVAAARNTMNVLLGAMGAGHVMRIESLAFAFRKFSFAFHEIPIRNGLLEGHWKHRN